jgi:Ca2+-binding RTX toxin-like protein
MGGSFGLRNDWRDNVSYNAIACFLAGHTQGRSRAAAKKSARHAGPVRRSALTFELLEPRLLLSADAFPGTQASYVADPLVGDGILSEFSTGLDAVETAVDTALADNDFTDKLNIALPGLLDRSGANPETDWKAPNLKDLLDLDKALGAGFTLVPNAADADQPNEIWDRNHDNHFNVGEIVERYVDEVLRNQIAAHPGDTGVSLPTIATALDGVNKALGEFTLTVDETDSRFSASGNDANYEFDLVVNLVRHDPFTLDLGRQVDGEVIDYGWNDPAANLPAVQLSSFYKLTLTLGLDATLSEQDLDPVNNPGGEQTTVTPVAFYVKDGAKVEAGAVAHENDLADFDLRLGFLELTAKDGTFELNATVTAAFVDGNSDGKINEAELATPPTPSAAGSATIVLPVEVKPIPGFDAFSDTFNIDAAGDPVARSITLTTTALFNDPTIQPNESGDPRTALPISFDNFTDLEPFRNIGGLDVISVLRQIEGEFNLLETLQPRAGTTPGSLEPLFGADLPFFDGTAISDIIDFGGGLLDQIRQLVQLPDGSIPDDLGLTTVVTPAFASVQGLVDKLINLLPDPDGAGPLTVLDVIHPSYDLVNHELRFGIAFDAPLTDADVDPAVLSPTFNFDLNLGPIANLIVEGTFEFNTLMTLAFTAGIDLDRAQEASVVSAFAPFGLISLMKTDGTNPITGELSNDARFRLDFGMTFPRVNVTLEAADTTGGSVDDLAGHLESAITTALQNALGDDAPIINVRAVGGRLEIISLDTPFLQITKLDTDAGGFDQLGFRDGQIATDGRMPENGILSAAAEFTLNFNGTAHTIHIDPDPGPTGNHKIEDLVEDIQHQVNDAFGDNQITVEYQPTAELPGVPPTKIGGVIAFKPFSAGALDFIAVAPLNEVAANELGLSDRVSADLLLVGDHSITVPVTVPASHQLSTDANFTLTFAGRPPVEVTVSHASTSDNASLSDLARDINAALADVDEQVTETKRLDQVISAVVELERDAVTNELVQKLVLKTISYDAFDSLTVSNVTGELTFPAGAVDAAGPRANGQVTDAKFVLQLELQNGEIKTIDLTADGDDVTYGGGTLSGLVAAINSAIDAKVTGTELEGRVVAGIVDGARIGFAVIPDGNLFTTDDPKVLRVTSTNAETRDHLGFSDSLGVRAAGAIDAFVEDVSLEATLDASAHVTGTADFGYVGLQVALDIAIDGTASFEHADRIDLSTLLAAGTSLEAIEALPGNILDGFSINASATATASAISVTGGGGASGILHDLQQALGASPSLEISVADLLHPTDAVVTFDLGGVEDFANLDFSDVTLILERVAAFLGDLANIDFLSQPLPIVDLKLGDALHVVEDFLATVDDISANPAPRIQELLASINEGLSRFTDGAAGLSFTGGDLVFDLDFKTGFNRFLPLNIDLVDLLEGTGIPLPDNFVTLAGAANLEATFDATIHLGFGIDVDSFTNLLAAHPTDPSFALNAVFLKTGDPDTGGTGIDVTGHARASNVNFTAAVGPFGLFVTNGSAVLNSGGGLSSDAPAKFELRLPDGATPNRLSLGEILSPQALFDAIQAGTDLASLDFGVSALLPISFPTASNFIGNAAFTVTIPDPFNVGPSGTTFSGVQFPDFTAPDILALIADMSLLDSLNLFLEGIDLGLSTLGDLISGDLFGLPLLSKLPLIGDSLTDAGGFMDDIRNDVIQPLQDVLGSASALVPQLVDDLRDAMEEALHNAGFLPASSHIQIFVDGVLEDLASITDADEILFDVTIEKDIPLASFNADFGIPVLGFTASDPITIVLSPQLHLGFGLSKEDGFFLQFDPGSDLSIDLTVALPDMLTGRLGFLTVEATRPLGHGPELAGLFDVNVADGRVTFAELPSLQLDFDFGATVDVDLHLVLGFANDPGSFPSVSADFQLDWLFNTNLPGGYTNAIIELHEISLNLGSFLTDTVKPIFETISDILAPVQPIIDVMTDPLPVLSDLLGHDVSLLDIAGELGFVDPAMVDTLKLIADVLDVINAIGSGGPGVIVIQHDLVLGGSGVDISNPLAINGIGDVSAILTQLGGALDLPPGLVSDIAGAVGDVLGGLIGQASSESGSLTFPFLENPAEVIGVFFGRPMTLIAFDLPPLVFGFDISVFFPLLGPLGVQLDGGAHATLDFAFGYDTFGIAKFAENDFRYPLDLFRGFFVYDDSLQNPGVDVPEVVLDAFIRASAAINVGVASAGVGGGIYANINFDLRDPNNDFRVRIEEIIGNIVNDGPFGVFDTSGEIVAKLTAFIEILFVIDKEIQLGPDLPLVSFGSTPETTDPVLATDLGGGKLRLNMGQFAGDRLYGDLSDGNEDFTVSGDGDSITVTAFGRTQTFDGSFNQVVAFAGQGNDTIDFHSLSGIATEVHAGAGNDIITGGSGANLIYGDTGNDEITGGAAIDRLFGGAGDDCIDGLASDDIIFGEDGNDILSGGAGADRISGGKGDDAIDGGDNDDVLLAGDGNDVVAGGRGGDIIDAGSGADLIFGDGALQIEDCVLAGGLSNPTVTVLGDGNGPDDIAGGGGSDHIQGDGGNDDIWGDSSFSFTHTSARDGKTLDPSAMFVRAMNGAAPVLLLPAFGDDGADIISGGGGSDHIFGEKGNDILHGDLLHNFASTDPFDAGTANTDPDSDDGADVLDGGRGADKLFGNDGGDFLFGGADNDFLFGNAGGDHLSGDVGIDVLFGDNGSITLVGGVATTEFSELKTIDPAVGGDDTISGGLDNDYIFGGLGADTIGQLNPPFGNGSGDAGDDIIFGDNGKITFTYDSSLGRAFATRVESLDKLSGGDDDIAGGAGRDLIIGGFGGDTIHGDYGDPTLEPKDLDSRDVIFGDHGLVESIIVAQIKGPLVTRMVTVDSSAAEGGEDDIDGKQHGDFIFGGVGSDDLTGGSGDDIVIGDAGEILFGRSLHDAGYDAAGSLAQIDLLNLLTVVQSTLEADAAKTGIDVMSGGQGNDIVIGGGKGDTLYGDALLDGTNTAPQPDTELAAFERTDVGRDLLIGDNGRIDFAFGFIADPLVQFASPSVIAATDTSNDTGGADHAFGSRGSDVIIGGVNGSIVTETDELTGDAGEDVILGDNGKLTFNAPPNANNLELDRIETTDFDIGGDDHISGGADRDFALGGKGDDLILGDDLLDGTPVALTGDDILLGDQGVVLLAGHHPVTQRSLITSIETVAATNDQGGADQIFGNAGSDVVIGGVNGNDPSHTDELHGDADKDIIIGDEGLVLFNQPGPTYDNDPTTVDRILTKSFNLGGNDHIFGGADSDIALGGTGGDDIEGDNDPATTPETAFGRDILIGDQGRIELFQRNIANGSSAFASTNVTEIVTTDTTNADGGIDTIAGNGGGDIILGGVGGDILMGAAPSPGLVIEPVNINTLDDMLIGDEGRFAFNLSGPLGAADEGDDDPATLDLIETGNSAIGGNDTIHGDNGSDVALGGAGADQIYGDLYRGTGAGLISAPTPGKDVLFGDGGTIRLRQDIVTLIQSRDVGSGGDDFIEGNERGDIIIGGFGKDRLDGESQNLALMAPQPTGANNDIIIGDNGELAYLLASDTIVGRADVSSINFNPTNFDLDRIRTIAPTFGDADVIRGNSDSDIIFAGTGADTVWGDTSDTGFGPDGADGTDVIFGDHGKLYYSVGVNATLVSPFYNNFFFSIDTSSDKGGLGDLLFGNGNDDFLIGGQGDDLLFGGKGNDDIIGGHNISGTLGAAQGELAHDDLDGLVIGTFTGARDALQAEVDAFNGGLASIGNRLSLLNPSDFNEISEAIDGGEGDDVLAGDNAIIVRQGKNIFTGAGADDFSSPRFRTVGASGLLYQAVSTPLAGQNVTVGIDASVSATSQNHLDMLDSVARRTTVLDQSLAVAQSSLAAPTAARAFGNDWIVGGIGDDEILGGLGDDVMQGDGRLDLALNSLATPALGSLISAHAGDTFNVRVINPAGIGLHTLQFVLLEQVGDGNDYLEGNGGNDLMFGNLGADDLIGGSSSLFGAAASAGLRLDGADLIYGGGNNASVQARNAEFGAAVPVLNTLVPTSARHAEDADAILGDNGNIYRIVNADGTPARFGHDNPAIAGAGYSVANPVIVRAVSLIDYGYSYLGAAPTEQLKFTGTGAGDLIYGETGDDLIFGTTGDDVIFGNSEDDDIVGGHGADFILAGSGIDGIIGDDGVVMSARVPIPVAGVPTFNAEPLFGITFDAASINQIISTPGAVGLDLINSQGMLIKSAWLSAFRTDGVEATGISYDDIIFGGLGTDFIHGGDGDDAISGAEALPFYYGATNVVGGFTKVNDVLVIQQNIGTKTNPVEQPQPFWYSFAPYNPGHVLDYQGNYDPATSPTQISEFAYYNENAPLRKIMLNAAGTPVLNSSQAVYDFLLNFKSDEGVLDTRFATASLGAGSKATDGDDRIFGDLGNDWIVGGTGRDHMYGGRGDDLMNGDDNMDTPAQAPKKGPAGDLENNQADSFMAYTDVIYGGAGRDTMMHNTGGDRLIDWLGEFNNYIVPYSPFGATEVVRFPSPNIEQFLLQLSKADGADQRLPDAQLSVDQRLTLGALPPDPTRNFEPYGELGMVLQPDPDYSLQNGPPQDPQAGQLPGNQRDFRVHFADPIPTTSDLASSMSGTRFVAEPAAAIAAFSVQSHAPQAGVHLAAPIATTTDPASSPSSTRYSAEPAPAMFSIQSSALLDPGSGPVDAQTTSGTDPFAPVSLASIDWSGDYLTSTQPTGSRNRTSGATDSGLVMADFLFAPLTLPSSPYMRDR